MSTDAPAVRATFHHGDLHAALKRAAVASIAAHGIEAFSLRAAAVELGVSPSAAYKHFADKGELLAAVAADAFADLATRTEFAIDTARGRCRTPRTRAVAALEACGLAYLRFALDEPARFRLMFGPYGAGSSRSVRGTAASGQDPYQLLTRSLDDMLAAGAIAAGARAGAELTAWSAIHGLADLAVSRSLAHAGIVDLEPAARRIVKTLVAGWTRRGPVS